MRNLAAFLLLPLWLFACGDRGVPFTVTFEDAQGLKPGDKITLRGLAIGQVADLDIEASGVVVKAELQARFADKVDERARFRIQSEKLVTGKKQLVVLPGEPPGGPLKAGAHFKGEPGEGDPIDRAQAALEETVDHARSQAQGLGRSVINPDHQAPRAVGGTVDLDNPGTFKLKLVSVELEPTTAVGSDWDGPGAGEADPLVQLWAGERLVLLSPEREDTLLAEYEDLRSEPFHLGTGMVLKARVLDVDTGVDDEVGVVELAPSPADTGRTFRLAGGRIKSIVMVLEGATP